MGCLMALYGLQIASEARKVKGTSERMPIEDGSGHHLSTDADFCEPFAISS